jgi:hypothetical protein
VRGKATVSLLYDRAESFTVVAALSKESLEKMVAERKRQAATPPGPAVSPEEAERERERAAAAKARDEAQRAKDDAEKKRAKEEAAKARQEAERAREDATKAAAKAAGKAPAKAPARPSVPPKPAAAAPKAPSAAPRGEGPSGAASAARPAVKVLERVSVEQGKDQVLVRLATSGPVSYNASTGSKLSKEWIWLELFPVQAGPAVGKSVEISSPLVGEITVEQLAPEKVRVALQVLPPGISYVVTQQDRAVVIKVVRTE